MIEENRLALLRKRVERFQVESSAQQIADLKFLLDVVDELLAANKTLEDNALKLTTRASLQNVSTKPR